MADYYYPVPGGSSTVTGGSSAGAAGPSGAAILATPFSQGSYHIISAASSSNTETFLGAASYGTVGIANRGPVPSTTLFSGIRRVGFDSTAPAGNNCGYFTSQPQWFLGNSTTKGGFEYLNYFGPSDAATVVDARGFIGMGPTGAPGNANPTTLINLIGVGFDGGESVFKWIWNDGSGTASSATLGASFPCKTLSQDWYQLYMYAAPGSTSVFMQLTNLSTGAKASQTVSSDLPAVNTTFGYLFYKSNGATALAVSMDRTTQIIATVY